MKRHNAETIEPVTIHLGVKKFGKTWHVLDMNTHAQIGNAFSTKLAACAYAYHRQDTTYSYVKGMQIEANI